MKLYSIFDKKANIYNTPFPAPTDVHAARTFSMQVNNANDHNMLNFAPEDFSLYCIGTFNDHTGEIAAQTPEMLIEAEKLIKKETK